MSVCMSLAACDLENYLDFFGFCYQFVKFMIVNVLWFCKKFFDSIIYVFQLDVFC